MAMGRAFVMHRALDLGNDGVSKRVRHFATMNLNSVDEGKGSITLLALRTKTLFGAQHQIINDAQRFAGGVRWIENDPLSTAMRSAFL
jgi:hypothetical protein